MGATSQTNLDGLADTAAPTINITKDIPSQKKIAAYVAEQTNNSSVLAEIMATADSRKLLAPDGTLIDLPKDVARKNQLELLFYLTHILKPILTAETGFNYGMTASAFLCAHALNHLKGGHVPIQNEALSLHEGIGAHTLHRLRLENYQIMEHEPCIVLPEMLLQRLAPDLRLAYINGADEYDEAMLEFYYLDRQTLSNGIIAVNTHKSKGRKDILKFIKKYRPTYKVAETDCGITLIQRDVMPAQHPLIPKTA